MITITNVTMNGNFEWNDSNETLFVRGNFTKNDENDLMSFYCNMSNISSQMNDDSANVYINGSQISYTINSTDLNLISKFVNNVSTIINDLNAVNSNGE